MAKVTRIESREFDYSVPVVIIGGGAAGMVAALAAHEAGAEVLVLERDPLPRGSTALSAGLVPAAATRWQAEAGISDDADSFARDVMKKAHDEPDAEIVDLVTRTTGPALEWLADTYGLKFSVVADFSYPGHSARRMHGLPTRSGEELIDALREAVENAGIPVLCNAHVTELFADKESRVFGLHFERPGGSSEEVGCDTLVLACNGYGGNKELVAKHIKPLADALYFGHPGNQGDALIWGEALGAKSRHLNGHQGHGSVAHPAGFLISWATITEGGFQVNVEGERFSNEAKGYSEQAAEVLRQPEQIAWSVFDSRIAGITRQFEDFRRAEGMGAVLTADTIPALATLMNVPADVFVANFENVRSYARGRASDPFGRSFRDMPELQPPYCAVKVTGALFHTQGGLVVDTSARVIGESGRPMPNLYAAGGAACGVSGNEASGYLSGNGLLTAIGLGLIAGRQAAAAVTSGLIAEQQSLSSATDRSTLTEGHTSERL
ncbi:fumarate reductase flavoprotein subunit [Rhizobium petrolearium]|uniref:FAD-dependent oxidoreductase n=1 Tax=Neorhizobium petrolearium TaxID=515361 RepID=UPI001AE213F5|nr:FAD-dependent oxidoreductase [Neorhizobium petrolearium]MBP1845713.1 fumarate reductase flavoprotein subunit [Neorhizobium petrolearium]